MSTRTTIDNALEVRAERLRIVTRGWARRRGTSDRIEVGDANASDVVVGAERTRIGGSLSEEVGGSSSTRASRLDTNVHGHLKVSCKSETTLLGGAMADTQLGGMFVGAGMSDDLIAGGGARVTAAVDVWLAGLIGMEEKVGTVLVDAAFLEMYHTLFEREHGVGKHIAMTATFNGMVHATMKAGFRPMMKVMRSGVRNLVRGGGGGGGGAAPSTAPTPPAGAAAAGTGLLGTFQEAAGGEDIAEVRNVAPGDLVPLDEFVTSLDEAFAAENQRLGLDSLQTLGRTVDEGGSTEDAQTAVRRLQGQDTDEAAGVSNEVAGTSRRLDDELPPMRYAIGTDADGNRVLVEDPDGPYRLDEDGTGGFRAVPAEGADSETLRGLSVQKDADGRFRPVDQDESNVATLRPGGPGLDAYDETYEDLSSPRLLGSIQRDGENSPLVLDTVTETSTPWYRLSDSSDFSSTESLVNLESGSSSSYAWWGGASPSRWSTLDGTTISLGEDVRTPSSRRSTLDGTTISLSEDVETPSSRLSTASDGTGSPAPTESSIPWWDSPMIHQGNSSPTESPMPWRIHSGNSAVDPDARYNLDVDELGNAKLVNAPDGDYALRADEYGVLRAVPNPDLDKEFFTPTKDLRGHAVIVGADGNLWLFERYDLIPVGRGGYELVRDPYGPYMFQSDAMGRVRLVVDPEEADPLVNLNRLRIREQGNGRLLALPPELSDADAERWLSDTIDTTDALAGVPDNRVIYANVGVPDSRVIYANVGVPDSRVIYANVGVPDSRVIYANVGVPDSRVIYANVGVPDTSVPYANIGVPSDDTRHVSFVHPTGRPASYLEPVSHQNNALSRFVPPDVLAPSSHPPPDLDVTEVLDGFENAGRTADNLGAVEPPPVRMLDDAGASAGARLDEQGARWETPANPVEFSDEGHPGAGGPARLAEPEANSYFYGSDGAIGPGPARIQPPPPLPEGVVGGWSLPGLPSDFDTAGAIVRLEEQIALRNDIIGRAKLQDAKLQDAKLQGAKLQGIKGDDLRRLEAERDACKLVVAELRAGRDPRAALRARAQAISTTDPLQLQALTNLHASLDNRSAFFYPQGPEVSWDMHADVLAVLDGKVPPSVDTSDLVARWREMAQNMLVARADQTDPMVIQRGELYGKAEMAVRDAIRWVRQGRDPTDMLQRRIVALEARTLADGTTGAAEANILRDLVQQYRNLLEGSIDSLHLSPEWLDAVSNLRAAERSGDLDAGGDAQLWLELFTSLDGRGMDKLTTDDFADGTLINQIYADEIALLDGRLPSSLDTSDMAEQWIGQAESLVSSHLPEDPAEREALVKIQLQIQEAVELMRQGEDPTKMLQRQIDLCDARTEAQAGMRETLEVAGESHHSAPEVPYSERAAHILRGMVKQLRDNLGDVMPYGELRLSPEWLDTVSDMRDAQRNMDLDSVLDCQRLLEMLAKANDEAAAMLARQHRMTVHVDETNEMLRQAQLFIDVIGTRRSDQLRLGGLNRTQVEEVVRRMEGFLDDPDIHRSDDRRLSALNRTKVNEVLRQVRAFLDDVRRTDLNHIGDLEASDGAPVQNRLDAYWNRGLDSSVAAEPIDGQADAAAGSVRTSVTGAAGSVEDATPPVGRVLEGVETPPAGRTQGSDEAPALYRIDRQHLDQVDTAGDGSSRRWGAATEVPYSQDESVRGSLTRRTPNTRDTSSLPRRFNNEMWYLPDAGSFEQVSWLRDFCDRNHLRFDLLSSEVYARYLAETQELHQVSEAGTWVEFGAMYPAELAERWERLVTTRHVPKAPWLMLQDDEDE